MDNIATNAEMLYEKAKSYTETSLELFKLNAIDKTADIVSSLISRLALVLVVAMFTLFVNIALSLFLGKNLIINFDPQNYNNYNILSLYI